MLHVGSDKAFNCFSPIASVFDGWRRRVGRNRGGSEIDECDSDKQRETATAIQNCE
jgi:hypothetical protein